MKGIMMLAAALALGVSAPAAEAQRMTEEERRELVARMAELQRQMAEIQERLGRTATAYRLFSDDRQPFVWGGVSQRPRLGVVIATGRRPETDSIGAVLQAVTPDGPAHEAGLRAGDIVTRFRGEQLANARPYPGDRLIELARDMEEGDSIPVTYQRDRQTRTAVLVPEALDDFAYSMVMPNVAGVRIGVDSLRAHLDSARVFIGGNRWMVEPHVAAVAPSFGFAFGPGSRWSDMELVELNPQLGEYFGTTEGLLVIKAPRDSLLQVRSGDVILRIGGRVPNSTSHAVRILRSYEPGDEIRLEVMRQRRRQELRAVVPEAERRGAR